MCCVGVKEIYILGLELVKMETVNKYANFISKTMDQMSYLTGSNISSIYVIFIYRIDL